MPRKLTEGDDGQEEKKPKQPVLETSLAPCQTATCQCRIVWIVAAPQIRCRTYFGADVGQSVEGPRVVEDDQVCFRCSAVQLVDVRLAAHLQIIVPVSVN